MQLVNFAEREKGKKAFEKMTVLRVVEKMLLVHIVRSQSRYFYLFSVCVVLLDAEKPVRRKPGTGGWVGHLISFEFLWLTLYKCIK